MGAFFTSVFGSLFGWIAVYFTKKISYGLAIAAMVMTVTMVFYSAMILLLNGLGGAITNEWLLVGFWSILPDNAVTCLTACFTADVLRFLYCYKLFTIRAVSSAN